MEAEGTGSPEEVRNGEAMSNDIRYKEVISHPNWDPDHYRIRLPQETIASLPIKQVNRKEFREVLVQWDYNPTFYYPDKKICVRGEMGYDLNFRYVLEEREGDETL